MRSVKAMEMLFPGPRRLTLCVMLQEPQRWWSPAELARRAGGAPASLRGHLAALREAGLVCEKKERRRLWFRADPACPVFGELASIVAKLTSAGGTAETILVVEDQPATARITRILLESWGYRVIEAHNGEEALAAFERQGDGIHLLLTDVVMPGLAGPQLAAELRRRRPGLPIVFMSGHGVERPCPRAAFLPKPFSPGSLSRAIRKELGRTARSGSASAET